MHAIYPNTCPQVTDAPVAARKRLQEHIQSLLKKLDSEVQKIKSDHQAVLVSRQRKIIAALAVLAFVVLDDYLFDLF